MIRVVLEPAEPPATADVEALRALGIPEAAIARALERGDPEGAIFETVLMPAMAARTVTAREIEERGGPPVAQIQAMMESFGLSSVAPDAPAFTPEEADVFIELRRLEPVWPPELAVQLGRVYGRMLARIAQASVQLFRVFVEPRLREDDADRLARLRSLQYAFAHLLPLADPLLLGVHRRWLEHELAQAVVSEAETGAGSRRLPGAVTVSFLFCDLKNFTKFAQIRGDAAAIEAIDRFMETVVRERGEEFRLMKSLGDGFMLAYDDTGAAVAAGARVIEAMRPLDAPRVHAAVHRGVAIAREGDYFGTAVNLAARVLDAAAGDELLATREVIEQAGEEFEWEQAGVHRLRGVTELVDVFRLRLPEA